MKKKVDTSSKACRIRAPDVEEAVEDCSINKDVRCQKLLLINLKIVVDKQEKGCRIRPPHIAMVM